VVDAQPQPGVNMIGEDMVKGRAREAQSRSREVQKSTYSVTGERALMGSRKAHYAGAEPQRAEQMRPDVESLAMQACDGE
jgi:hypothetical protein